jgi:hypothetical protein
LIRGKHSLETIVVGSDNESPLGGKLYALLLAGIILLVIYLTGGFGEGSS